MPRTALPAPPCSATLMLLATAVLLSGCGKQRDNPAPLRIEAQAGQLPSESSTIVVPVTADLAALERGLNQETPRVLWTIDQHRDRCVAAKKIDLGIGKLKVLPDLGCRLVGRVTRGAIRLSGKGERLDLVMPVSAAITAQNVGGVLSKTATGTAVVRATGRLGIVGDWQPTAKLDIAYDWREEPGVDVAGQRVTFTSRADAKLRGIVGKLERDLPRQLAKLHLRDQLAQLWPQGFTSIELSKRNPPAWLRVTPRALGFGGYRVDGRTLRLTLAAEALTETFVGQRPPDPAVTPLPAPTRVSDRAGLRFSVPVLADYRTLEPVVERALRKLAARGISVTGVGPVDVAFGKVTVYATQGGRLAVGVRAKVTPRAVGSASTSGEAWLTAVPYNDPGSQLVRARDVQLVARTDSTAIDLLIRLLAETQVQRAVALALQHDFHDDYAQVLGKAQRAIGARQQGDFFLSTDVTSVANGQLQVTGAGLFLPVRAEGTAMIAYRPR
ncbi:DUF4403 family protein [Sphingomonas sp. BK580]|uniref:DUF4403 family protein n=1 Tax=Sphingomonas sp. BK580 TaxID=2586972 RepID=UPI001791E7A1|nr:DUF4403 family protein [Sphingomonas sp. BK580]MBB3692923.1 hypothetical protein [Sphingomonas sp. BK580]